ncbi:unnamed protein product [Paramecium octaurelia]|uniref:Uncharacterized protein n=1 Tax=Paramecium octaurelia TaxID=43137 RepID=A0A8S1U9Q8_PAROT|nr:unnamed protein product [Paramecium octaurelia]
MQKFSNSFLRLAKVYTRISGCGNCHCCQNKDCKNNKNSEQIPITKKYSHLINYKETDQVTEILTEVTQNTDNKEFEKGNQPFQTFNKKNINKRV